MQQKINFLFLSLCVYLFKSCPSQFLCHWESGEPVFCREELIFPPFKNQNKSLIFPSGWMWKFKFYCILMIIQKSNIASKFLLIPHLSNTTDLKLNLGSWFSLKLPNWTEISNYVCSSPKTFSSFASSFKNNIMKYPWPRASPIIRTRCSLTDFGF